MDDKNQEKKNQEKKKLENEMAQKINWVEPEEHYVNQGEFIGPNTYRSGKMGTEFEEAYQDTSPADLSDSFN